MNEDDVIRPDAHPSIKTYLAIAATATQRNRERLHHF